MQASDSNLFGLILMALSVAFMLWVLWNFHKASANAERFHDCCTPKPLSSSGIFLNRGPQRQFSSLGWK